MKFVADLANDGKFSIQHSAFSIPTIPLGGLNATPNLEIQE